MSKLKNVGGLKVEKLDEKTLPQKLLPGALFLLISTILGFSVKYVTKCDISCALSGVGLGTTGLTLIYIIIKGLKDYGAF